MAGKVFMVPAIRRPKSLSFPRYSFGGFADWYAATGAGTGARHYIAAEGYGIVMDIVPTIQQAEAIVRLHAVVQAMANYLERSWEEETEDVQFVFLALHDRLLALMLACPDVNEYWQALHPTTRARFEKMHQKFLTLRIALDK
jgi:hypothetical protein